MAVKRWATKVEMATLFMKQTRYQQMFNKKLAIANCAYWWGSIGGGHKVCPYVKLV